MIKNNIISKAMLGIVLISGFVNCVGKSEKSEIVHNTTNNKGIKIAYVNIDSLLLNYNYYIDLNESMVQKGENVRLELTKEREKLEKQFVDFQEKLRNGIFASKQRAEQEQARIIRLKNEFEKKSADMQEELLLENERNNNMLREKINEYIKEYNKTHNYDLILSNASSDNILFAIPSLNITKEITDGLNDNYKRN